MNYQHIYHAGNFADVFKHWILMLILEALQKKDTPFVYIDTHAGAACYDLSSDKALQTTEASAGIECLWKTPRPLTDSLTRYCQIVREFQNNQKQLKYYPGSPCVAHALLRKQDKMILNELRSAEAELLKNQFHRDSQVHVHSNNAYQWLAGILPPNIARGVVFIDPPYEQDNEYEQILKLLTMALKRWRQGIFIIWYPVTKNSGFHKFAQELKKLNIENVLNTQLNIYEHDSPIGLNGSGLLIINPPWKLEEAINESIKNLWEILSLNQKGRYVVNTYI